MLTMSRASPSPAPNPAGPMNAVAKLSPDAEPAACLADIGVGGRVVRLEEKDLVFSQGDPADAVFYVQKGQVKLTVVSNTGKEAILGIVREGEFVGSGCLAGARFYLKTATAMTDCELLRIDRDVMTRALHRNDALAALFVGTVFIAIQYLAYNQYVTVDWEKIRHTVPDSSLHQVWMALMSVFTYNFPFAGAFAAGFLLGFRKG